ncbi:hypothetical protein FGG08_005558 [Glutinoglossum americanum]|uniref:Protein BZZ1 n=1 Tax=Glutinoglossum americanum TaxID=1670608 RepID=A0A9P8KYE8_9PEZI|nr:hypothetical protein FGG08_005558 [Glutinoglossum americanum]
MADIDVAPSFGAELKVANGISWLDDVQQFYRERSTIEKEYGAKLNALAKKYFDKKAKKSSTLSVGETPTMTPGSLESASVTTWTKQLTTLESRAAEHERFSSDLITNLADPLKALSVRYEEIRKRHAEYAVRLEKEKDTSLIELKKVKGSYDGVCQEVEIRRKKAESASDYAKPKAQNSYHQQLLDMHNVKNTYVIAINVTNKQKEKYYHEYVPELLDVGSHQISLRCKPKLMVPVHQNLQDLSQTRTATLNVIWSTAAQLETSTLTRSTDQLHHLEQEITRNNPILDSAMFITHNTGNWQEPLDIAFEPSPIWHDDGNIVVDEATKIFLKNLLGKSKSQLKELKQEVGKKRREVEELKRKRESVRAGRDKTDEVELVRAILAMQDELHQIDHKRLTAEVETSTIVSTVGDVSLGARNHNFKSQTFKIPTNCDLCGDRIWGLSAKGFDCKDCGFTCHSKCELKVPAECPGEQSKEEKKKLKIERQEAAHASRAPSNGGPPEGIPEMPTLSRSNTMNSLSSGYAASAHRSLSVVGGLKPPAELPTPDRDPEPVKSATISSKPSTLTKRNRIVAPPPAAYITELPTPSEPKANTPELPARNVDRGNGSSTKPKPSEQKGKMLYPYKASGEGEITVGEGKDVVILDLDDGSGWMRVRYGFSEGLVPASYVEAHSPPSPHHSSPVADRPSSTYSNSSASLGGSSTMKKKGPAVAPKRGARKLKYVRALYEYEAGSDAEWSMNEGERFVLVNRDAGGGWADVEKGGLVKSVPANYIEDVS